MSYLREIADSLADGLAAVAWSIAGTTVERRNWAQVDVSDMDTPVIFVTPGSAEVQRISRTTSQTDYSATVFIGQHVQADAEVDAIIDLTDQAMLHIRAHAWQDQFPSNVTSPQTISIELNPDDALNERNVWRAVIEVTYRVFEADELPE